MQVILKEDIRALGKAGEVVKVSEGYGRNFLLPLKKAELATEGNLKRLAGDKQSIEGKRAKLRKEAEVLAAKLTATPLVMERSAGEEDKLFGSVTNRQIAEALASQGFSLDHRLIHLKEPIRKAGTYTIEVHLHGEVVAPLTVEVRKK